jgi:hypothetical protein
VHTSAASLQAGEPRLAEIKVQLQKEGRLQLSGSDAIRIS